MYHVFTVVIVQNHLSGVAVVTEVATRKKNEYCGDFLSCKVFTELFPSVYLRKLSKKNKTIDGRFVFNRVRRF